MTALVFDVRTFEIESAVMLPVLISTSANTGIAPALITLETEAIKVRGVTTTSSPGPIFRALRATSKAKVPFASETACSVPHQAANSFSNSRHSEPVQ